MLTEKTFNIGTLAINYAEGSDSGSPLVLLHGALASWQDLSPLITGLEHHWHVFACDKRGHGKSGRASSYRAVDFFPDTADFINRQIGIPTMLLGHSGGAIVALGAAIQIPELIRGLILLDPPLFLREESIRSNYVYNIFYGMYLFLLNQKTAHETFPKLFPGIDEEGIHALENMVGQVDPEFVRTLIEDRYFEGMNAQFLLESVTCPTLLLYGEIEKGGVVRDRDVEFFHKHISNGIAIPIHDAGHLLLNDQPVRVLELIEEFALSIRTEDD